eukprot:7235425-Alexandrium_andersonii.AAC.1
MMTESSGCWTPRRPRTARSRFSSALKVKVIFKCSTIFFIRALPPHWPSPKCMAKAPSSIGGQLELA